MEHDTLFEAARTGNIQMLNHLLSENPLLLTDVALSCPKETPLHVAVKAGQLAFVHQIIKCKPEFAAQVSKDGYRPLDIAVITGQIDIVRQLLKTGDDGFQLCRLQGKDRRTALHYAAANGRVEIINELVSICPKSVLDLTIYGETALHLAVKNNQFHAYSLLIEWLKKLNETTLINLKDCDGNSVLHVAAARRQYESLELLVGEKSVLNGVVQVTATNSKGLTAMDILDIVMEEPNDVKIRKILQNSRGVVEEKKQSQLYSHHQRDKIKIGESQLSRIGSNISSFN